ncbi:DUF3040 domain-containing protein [Peterkaempfera sp. SMS 1(5)a]|uniref:DUF3040 domain-containing protein n=1 Tax=Peterkaempfera podocarpi TaxID=3232308 RepID=UPI003671C50D
MGLSMHDRRVLADIEQHLSQRDPVLDRLLTGFGDRRSRLRAALRDLWVGTAVVAAGVVFLAGMVLVSVGSAAHDRMLIVGGGVGVAFAELTVVSVLVATWRRRRREEG